MFPKVKRSTLVKSKLFIFKQYEIHHLQNWENPLVKKTVPMHENMISLFMVKCLHYEKKKVK